jgi:hypothetical protein
LLSDQHNAMYYRSRWGITKLPAGMSPAAAATCVIEIWELSQKDIYGIDLNVNS